MSREVRPYTGRQNQRLADLSAKNANLLADGKYDIRTEYEAAHRRMISRLVASIRGALPDYVSKYGV